MAKQPKYDIGARVLVSMNPDYFEGREAFIPAVITKHLGIMDLYDGRISQSEVNFPVKQHFYEMRLKEGGETINCEGMIVLDTRKR